MIIFCHIHKNTSITCCDDCASVDDEFDDVKMLLLLELERSSLTFDLDDDNDDADGEDNVGVLKSFPLNRSLSNKDL